jgi:tRNA-2-methylthio-N6-dimethylallyladenosine synthase
MKFCLVSLGCQMNLSDSERVSAVLEELGYVQTELEEDADILGLVACSVRQRAIDRAYGRIRKWNDWKKQKNLLTFATGCVLPTDKEQFVTLFDLVFQINDLPDLPDMIRQHGVVTPTSVNATDRGDFNTDFWKIRPAYASSFDAFVPIQNGCDKFCSFCAVPYTRGREVSRSSEEILSEVKTLIESGYRSITLLGQNVNSYGRDRVGEEISFARLLENIGEMGARSDRDFWVYFTSPHPRDMSRDVLEVIASYPVLAKQLHLPIQSGDDKVLIRMNRNYNVDRYREVVSNIREILPTATLFTDIIVGFPGETLEQFEGTRKAMLEFNYNMAYIAMYSPRPGARSFRMDDDIPHDEKRRRLHELSTELKTMSLRHNQSLIGKTETVLVSGRDRDGRYLSGRNEGKIIIRFATDNDELIGSFCKVQISTAAEMSVEGSLVAERIGAGQP